MSLLGTTVGNISIVDRIGEGGMGAIYVGFDEKLQREVALKVLRSDRFDAEAKTRLLREARILSRLENPRICKIFDYLEGEETDFLILELVHGRNLRDALRDELDESLKLKIAEQVAQALVAAHTQGIVHRDLKPENVMLSDSGDVKVLDFGLAFSNLGASPEETASGETASGETAGDETASDETAEYGPAKPGTASESAEISLHTVFGKILGTASYMSPEQARGDPMTVASDLYSFGLLLQELFTGSSPYEKGLSPHLVLLRASEGETVPVKGLDPDLMALINRLKSPGAEARPSALETLERLRWIRDKPKRRRRRLAAVLVVLVVLLGLAKHNLDLRRERATALAAQREAEAVVSFLVDLFEVSDPIAGRGNTITAREVLDEGAGKIRRELQAQPLVQARLMETIGAVYTNLGLYEEAAPLLEEALSTREEIFGERHLDVARSLEELGDLFDYLGRYGEAEELFRRALAIRRELVGGDHPSVAENLYDLGWLYLYQDRIEEAEPLLRRSLSIREAAFGREHPQVALSLNGLAALQYQARRYDEAVALYERSLAIREKTLGGDHPEVSASLYNLALVYTDQGDYAAATELYRRSLRIDEETFGPDHPHVALTLSNLAETCLKQGLYADSEPLFQRAVKIQEDALGADHPDVGRTLGGLAALYRDQKRYGEAEPLFRRAWGILETSLGAAHPDARSILSDYAGLLRATGREAEAERLEALVEKAAAGD